MVTYYITKNPANPNSKKQKDNQLNRCRVAEGGKPANISLCVSGLLQQPGRYPVKETSTSGFQMSFNVDHLLIGSPGPQPPLPLCRWVRTPTQCSPQ